MNDTIEQKPRAKRRWLSFSLRTFLGLILLSCVPLAWLGREYARMAVEDRIVEEILAADGFVIYDYQLTRNSDGTLMKDPRKVATGPKWIRVMLGENIFGRIECVWLDDFATNEKLIARLPQLQQLESLLLNSNSMTDKEIDSLLAIKQLKELSLDADKVSAEGLNRLSAHPSLRKLELYGELSSPETLQRCGPWPQLSELDLHTNMAKDEALRPMLKGTKLQALRLYYMPKITMRDSEMLADLHALEELTVPGASIDDRSLVGIAKLSQLRWLDLRQTDITDEGLPLLTSLEKLKVLDVGNTAITPQGLKALEGMGGLEKIMVSRANGPFPKQIGSTEVIAK